MTFQTKLHFSLRNARHVEAFIRSVLDDLKDMPLRSLELRAEVDGTWSVLAPPSLGVAVAKAASETDPTRADTLPLARDGVGGLPLD